jgi:hypothetical protein
MLERERRATCANAAEREPRVMREEDTAEREKRAAMDVMFAAMLAMTIVTVRRYPKGALLLLFQLSIQVLHRH